MQRIIWSPAARSDLDRIANWLDDNRGLEFSASTLTIIHLRARFLEDFPRGGRPVGNDRRMLRVLGTRYLIVYRLSDSIIDVIRIHHEREDWQTEI